MDYMLPDNDTLQFKARTFVETVVKTEKVWGLEGDGGWAVSDSNDYEDTEVIPFWSSPEEAAACAVEEWAEYKITEIPLADFLENWIINMHNEELLAGLNFNTELEGKELEPLELALKIIDELSLRGKTVEFESFDSMDEFEIEVKRVLAE